MDIKHQAGTITLSIDIGSSFIKAAILDSNIKIPQIVFFNQEQDTHFPSAIYIPKDNSFSKPDVLFGYEALEKFNDDEEGVIFDIIHLMRENPYDIDLPSRIKVSTQDLISQFLMNIKKIVEELNCNHKTIHNCSILKGINFTGDTEDTLRRACRTANFKRTNFINETRAVANYWIYNNVLSTYQSTKNLLLIDIKSESTTLRHLVNNGFSFQEKVSSDFPIFDFGGKFLVNTVLEILYENGIVSEEIDQSLPVHLQIKQIKSELENHIYTASHFYYDGITIDLPNNIVEQANERYFEQLSNLINQFFAHIDEVKEDFSTIILTGGASSIPGLSNFLHKDLATVAEDNNSEFIYAMGGALNQIPSQELKSSSKQEKLELKPGVKFGVYTISKKIGQGGMGEVWLAHHDTMDVDVAIKVLHGKLTKSQDSVHRFLSEIRNSAKLRHKNLIPAHDAGNLHGIYYLVSDFVNGREVANLLKERKFLDEEEALVIAKEIAIALDYAWKSHKLLHRDIKPENIMISNEGEVKLMDMGISKSLLENKPDITSDDTLLGTPHYMSPEQINGTQADFRSDIYSLGATLYHLLTGQRPFEGSSIISVATKHLNEDVPNPALINNSITETTVTLLDRMMKKDQNQRQQSWEEVIENIDTALQEITGQAPVEEHEGSHKATKLTKIFAALIITLLTILTFVMINLRNKATEQDTLNRTVIPIQIAAEPFNALIKIYKDDKVVKRVQAKKIENKVHMLRLPRDKFIIEISLDSYHTVTKEVRVSKRNNSFTFNLKHQQGTLVIKTLPGAKVFKQRLSENILLGTADENGEYITVQDIGTKNLLVRHEGFIDQAIQVEVETGLETVKDVELKLAPNYYLITCEESYDIYHNDELIGKTNTPFKIESTALSATVSVRKRGFHSKNINVNLSSLYPTKIEQLEPLTNSVKLTFKVLDQEDTEIPELIPESIKYRISEGDWKTLKAPFVIEDLLLTEHTIEISLNDYTADNYIKKVTIYEGKDNKLNFNLRIKSSQVRFISEDDAKVYYGKKLIGRTNEILVVKCLSKSVFTIKLENHESKELTVDIDLGTLNEFKIPRLRYTFGSLKISFTKESRIQDSFTIPSTVEVKVNNGKWMTKQHPINFQQIPCGQYKIAFRMKNAVVIPTEKEVDINENESLELNLEVRPEDVYLYVDSNVNSASIFNEKSELIGSVNNAVKVCPFVFHNLTMKSDGYQDMVFKVRIDKIENSKVKVIMKRDAGLIRGNDFVHLKNTFKFIKPNSFAMGSNDGNYDEKPVHTVNLSEPFWISESEVTVENFAKVMSIDISHIDDSKKQLPVTNITWSDAVEYCKELTKQLKAEGLLRDKDMVTLPTESEWEFCCRANSKGKFSFGDNLNSDQANIDGTFDFLGSTKGQFRKKVVPVKSFEPNNFGLYDMHGNVWEWCLTDYLDYKVKTAGTKKTVVADKVLRGGSWKSYPKNSRITSRYNRPRSSKDGTIGFRPVIKIKDK